jgi:hypothetical protein
MWWSSRRRPFRALFVLGILCCPALALAKVSVEKLARRCRSGDDGACAKLAAVARDHSGDFSIYVRLAALEELTDAAVLCEIALSDEKPEMAVAATRKLPGESLLARVAGGARSPSARTYAIGRLSDREQLARIAQTEENADVGVVAVKKLDDKALLVEVIRGAKAARVRTAAIEQLEDPAVLAEIATADESAEVGVAAVKKLVDQRLLSGVARGARAPGTRASAVERLTDLAELTALATADPDENVRHTAAILVAARTQESPDAQWTAVKRLKVITDPRLLVSIAEATDSPRLRNEIAQRLYALAPEMVAAIGVQAGIVLDGNCAEICGRPVPDQSAVGGGVRSAVWPGHQTLKVQYCHCDFGGYVATQVPVELEIDAAAGSVYYIAVNVLKLTQGDSLAAFGVKRLR